MVLLIPYHFFEVLFQHLGSDEVIVCGNGTASVIPFQVAAVKKGQRMFANSGCASMGYDLPAAIGAAVAREGKRVICLAGDGSIQMNLQELQTVAHHQLPIKIFVLIMPVTSRLDRPNKISSVIWWVNPRTAGSLFQI